MHTDKAMTKHSALILGSIMCIALKKHALGRTLEDVKTISGLLLKQWHRRAYFNYKTIFIPGILLM